MRYRSLCSDYLDIVKAYSLILGDKRQAFHERLGYEHPIKWVSMVRGELFNRQSMFGCDIQGGETMQAKLFEIIISENFQLAQSPFDRDFPCRGGAHIDDVVPVEYGGFRCG